MTKERKDAALLAAAIGRFGDLTEITGAAVSSSSPVVAVALEEVNA